MLKTFRHKSGGFHHGPKENWTKFLFAVFSWKKVPQAKKISNLSTLVKFWTKLKSFLALSPKKTEKTLWNNFIPQTFSPDTYNADPVHFPLFFSCFFSNSEKIWNIFLIIPQNGEMECSFGKSVKIFSTLVGNCAKEKISCQNKFSSKLSSGQVEYSSGRLATIILPVGKFSTKSPRTNREDFEFFLKMFTWRGRKQFWQTWCNFLAGIPKKNDQIRN